MGYRSCVALLLYGAKEDCDLVVNLFVGSSVEQDLKQLFDRQKQEHTTPAGEHSVFWTFDDIKWYSDADAAKDLLMRFVKEIEEAREGDKSGQPLALEFVRVGEEPTDIEYEATDQANWRLGTHTTIDYPADIFQWRV